MSPKEFYPQPILNLPQADLPFPQVTAWLMQGQGTQSVFFTLPQGATVPPHSHCAQWGVVLSGTMTLRIGQETKKYSKGDSYFIGQGVEHEASIDTDCHVLDVFFQNDRYRPKA